MELTDDDIKEFQDIWRQAFDEEVSEALARERGSQLLELYVSLAKDHEVLRILPEIERGGGPPSSFDRESAPGS